MARVKFTRQTPHKAQPRQQEHWFQRRQELRRHRCVAFGFVVFTLLSSGGCGSKNVSAAAAPPPNVQIVEVIQRDVPVYHEYLATLDGFVNAQIQPQVSGYLIRQNYVEGAVVSRNQVLFKIDPRPFQAIVDQAKAQVAQAEAQLGKTQLDVQRDTPLAKEKAIAQSQLDNDIQANLAAKATVQADKAALEQAELNLEFTNVRSLVDGVAGIAAGQVGNLVGPQIVLTTVSQVEPVKAYFTVSEQEYLAFVKRNPTAADRAAREKQFELDLILADGSTYPRKGKFLRRRSSSGYPDGIDSAGWSVSESRQCSSSRPVWPRPFHQLYQERRAARAPEIGGGASGKLPGGSSRERQQSYSEDGHSRRTDRRHVDH